MDGRLSWELFAGDPKNPEMSGWVLRWSYMGEALQSKVISPERALEAAVMLAGILETSEPYVVVGADLNSDGA